MTSNTTTTVLRVKRPRHVEPVSFLQVDLNQAKKPRLDALEIGFQQLLHTSSYISKQQEAFQTKSQVVTLERIHDISSNESIHYVHARLDHDENAPKAKRQRLALTLLCAEKEECDANKQTLPTQKKNLVLDPLSRLVNNSLKQVFSGTLSVKQHLDLILYDSRFTCSRNWMHWCVSPGGTILHAAALHNNVESVQQIMFYMDCNVLFKSVDQDGKTPLEVATMAGHDDVVHVLERYNQHQETQQQEEDYVYDMFCIQEETKCNNETNDTNHVNDGPHTMVQLRGGVGYWNEQGELVLEALDERHQVDSDVEEEDSNCEAHEGNDYPDEEEWEDDDSDHQANMNFRQFQVPGDLLRHGGFVSSVGGGLHPTKAFYNNNDDDDDDYYDHIDAQYEHYEGPPEEKQQRLYAYDPDLDHEDNVHYND